MSPQPPSDAGSPDPGPDTATEDHYYQRVERHFGLRRGGPLMLSPRDWKLVQRWFGEGVPLPVVLRGINRAFDRFAASGPRADRINSLRYCEQHVAEEWQRHRDLAAAEGSPGTGRSGLADAVDHLTRAAHACRRAADDGRLHGRVRSALTATAGDLEELAAATARDDPDAGALDERAGTLERALMQRLRDADPADPRLADVADMREWLRLPPFSPYGL